MKHLRLTFLLIILFFTIRYSIEQKRIQNEDLQQDIISTINSTPEETPKPISSEELNQQADKACKRGIQAYLDGIFMRCMDDCLNKKDPDCENQESGTYCKGLISTFQIGKYEDTYQACVDQYINSNH
jgi:hypothetical protein